MTYSLSPRHISRGVGRGFGGWSGVARVEEDGGVEEEEFGGIMSGRRFRVVVVVVDLPERGLLLLPSFFSGIYGMNERMDVWKSERGRLWFAVNFDRREQT